MYVNRLKKKKEKGKPISVCEEIMVGCRGTLSWCKVLTARGKCRPRSLQTGVIVASAVTAYTSTLQHATLPPHPHRPPSKNKIKTRTVLGSENFHIVVPSDKVIIQKRGDQCARKYSQNRGIFRSPQYYLLNNNKIILMEAINFILHSYYSYFLTK